MEDLDYFIKSQKIFQNKKMQLALAVNHVDAGNSNAAGGDGHGGPGAGAQKDIDYYFFYKADEKSNKKAKKQMEKDQSSLSHQDKMLMKNIKILLRDLSDMGMLKA